MPVSRECCMCYSPEVSATGRSLVQGGLTECGMSEYDFENPTVRRPWPTRTVETWEKK